MFGNPNSYRFLSCKKCKWKSPPHTDFIQRPPYCPRCQHDDFEVRVKEVSLLGKLFRL